MPWVAYSKSTCRVGDKQEIVQGNCKATVGNFPFLVFPGFAQAYLEGMFVSLQRHHELYCAAHVHSEV